MAKISSAYQGVKGVYYLVNPAGAVHSVTKEHATARLRSVGWRLAEDGEIEQYLEKKVQRWQKPIAERWSPEPEIETILPPAHETTDEVSATETARELAAAKGLDLKTITGTGAEGRILVKDVEAALAK